MGDHGGDLNENGNFRNGKLIIHGHTILHRGDLNGNEHLKTKIIHLIFWDRRINVIFVAELAGRVPDVSLCSFWLDPLLVSLGTQLQP